MSISDNYVLHALFIFSSWWILHCSDYLSIYALNWFVLFKCDGICFSWMWWEVYWFDFFNFFLEYMECNQGSCIYWRNLQWIEFTNFRKYFVFLLQSLSLSGICCVLYGNSSWYCGRWRSEEARVCWSCCLPACSGTSLCFSAG